MVGPLSRDDRGIGDEWEMDARIGHQISLELIEVDIQCSIKPE